MLKRGREWLENLRAARAWRNLPSLPIQAPAAVFDDGKTELTFTAEEQKDYLAYHVISKVAEKQGKINLYEVFKRCPDVTEFPVEELLKGKKHIKELCLACWPEKMPFPEEIFELENIKILELTRFPFSDLSENLGNLKKLEKLLMYGSAIRRMPRSMGKLKKLQEFDPYTSYHYHYLPYEVKNCPLNDTRMSTRALFNNYKNRMELPPLPKFPVDATNAEEGALYNILDTHVSGIKDIVRIIMDYHGSYGFVCSLCERNCTGDPLYIWTHEKIGTDSVALLGRMCSRKCVSKIDEKTRCFYTSALKNCRSDLSRFREDSYGSYGRIKSDNIRYGLDIDVLDDFYKNGLGVEFTSYDFIWDKENEEVVSEMNVEFKY